MNENQTVEMLCCGAKLDDGNLRQYWSKLDEKGQQVGEAFAYGVNIDHAHAGEIWAFATDGTGVVLDGKLAPNFVAQHPNRALVNSLHVVEAAAISGFIMHHASIGARQTIIDNLLQTIAPLRSLYQNSDPSQRLEIMEQLVQYFNIDEAPPVAPPVWKVGDYVDVNYPAKNLYIHNAPITDVYFDLVKVENRAGDRYTVPTNTLSRSTPPTETGIDNTPVLT